MPEFLGFGNDWYGGWVLVSDAKLPSPLEPGYTDGPELIAFEGPINLTSPAASPTCSFGEGEEDICFHMNVGNQLSMAFGLDAVECEITNPILPFWGAEFDWRINNAPKVSVKGWFVWDERHDHGPFTGALEIHPIRELRFYVPSENAEYRCLFMDTSGRGGPLISLLDPVIGPAVVSQHGDERFGKADYVWDKRKLRSGFVSGKALLPWKSVYSVFPSSAVWIYREKLLFRCQADYDLAENPMGGLTSLASLNGQGASVIVQDSLQNTYISELQLPNVDVVTHQGIPKFRYRFQLQLKTGLPNALQNPWELVPSSFNPDKYGYEFNPQTPEIIIAQAFLSPGDIHGPTPLEFSVKIQGKATLIGKDRTLPHVTPFDSLVFSLPRETFYISGRRKVLIPCPSITLEGSEVCDEELVIYVPEMGGAVTKFIFRTFSLHLINFPQPPMRIEWQAHTDSGAVVPYVTINAYTIRIESDPAPDEDIIVEVTVTDAIGTVYSASRHMRGVTGALHKIVPEIGKIKPSLPDPMLKASLRHRLASGQPLVRAAARVEESLHLGQGRGLAFRNLGEELARVAVLARDEKLSALERRNFEEFLATPGRSDARLGLQERLRLLAEWASRLGEAFDRSQAELTGRERSDVNDRFGSFSMAGIELEAWELVDAQNPTKSISGVLSELPESLERGWKNGVEWQFRIAVPDANHEIYAGRYNIQGFSGVDCRATNPLFEVWGQHLRDLLSKAQEVSLTGYWTYNVSGCQGYKIELQPVTDIGFTADQCDFRCAFVESSGRFLGKIGQTVTRIYRAELAGEDAIYGGGTENVWIYVEKVLAGSNHIVSTQAEFRQLETEVLLPEPGAYYVSQSRIYREHALDVTLSRVSLEEDEEGTLVHRYFINAVLKPNRLPLPSGTLASVQWDITGCKGKLMIQSLLEKRAEFALDVSAEALRQGKTIRADIGAQAVCTLSGQDRILPVIPPFEHGEVQNAPVEKAHVRGFQSFFIPMPVIDLHADTRSPKGKEAGRQVLQRYDAFEVRLSHFPIAPSIAWEVADDEGQVVATIEEGGKLRIESFPDYKSDVRVTVEVVDPTGFIIRKSVWSYPRSVAYVPDDDCIFYFPAELCHWFDGESKRDSRVTAGASFSKLIQRLWRCADRSDGSSASALLAEMARRLDTFTKAIRDGLLNENQVELTEQWFDQMFFRREPLWLIILLSRLRARAIFRRAVEGIHEAELSRKFEELSNALRNISKELSDPTHVHLGAVQRIEVPRRQAT